MKFSYVFILVGMLFLASCAKLPVYKSKSYNQNAINESTNSIADMNDKKANVYYGFANDNTHFYIRYVFDDRESLMKIMRGGLIIYFDPNGKKGKDYQLKIEKTDQQQNDYTRLSAQGLKPEKGERQSLPSTIAVVLNKVTWDKNGKELVFYRNMQKEPILVELSPANQDQLILDIKMPISEIPLQEGSSTFALGIESGKNSAKGMSGSGPDGGRMQSGGGMGGPGGGGMGGSGGGGMGGPGGPGGGGMGGPGGGGGGMGGGGGRPDGASPSSSATNPIKIWCKVQL